MSSNILERIENETDLTKSERKLAQVILKDPAIVVNENIAQLAKHAQVSEPSVCRFCKRFGADGFPAFKLVLSAVVSANKVNRVEGVKQGDTVEDVVTKVISLGKNSLLKLEKNIDETMVAKVIDVVSQARRIVVLAQGLNTFVGVDFQNRMLNLGFATELYTDKQAMSLALATLRVSDVALCISSNGEEIDLVEALAASDNTGAITVSICPKDTKLSKATTLSLAVEDHDYLNFDSLMSSRISLLLVSQILIGGIQLRRGIAIKDYKDKLSNARAKAFYFNQESNQEQSTKEDDSGELKSNTPITTLDWHPY